MLKHIAKLSNKSSKLHINNSKLLITQSLFGKSLFTKQFSTQSHILRDFTARPQNDQNLLSTSPTVTKIPDYELSENQPVFNTSYIFTNEELSDKHPTEYVMQQRREAANIFAMLKPQELLLMNLPDNITKEQLHDLCKARDLLIHSIKLMKAMDDTKTAYAKIELVSPKQAQILRDRLKGKWIEDKQLKVRTREEEYLETFDNRTIVVQGIPETYTQTELITLFKEYGAITGIEIPTFDKKIQQALDNKDSYYSKQKKEKDLKDYRRAEEVMQNSLRVDERYHQYLVQELGKEQAQQMLESNLKRGSDVTLNELLEDQRFTSLSNIISTLQSEDSEVKKSIDILTQLKTEINAQEATTELSPSITSDKLKEVIEANKDKLGSILKYINKTKVEAPSLDTLTNLQNMSQKELTLAYDGFLNYLSERERIITDRLKDSLKHLGTQERILFEGKDFSKEFEDLPYFDQLHEKSVEIERISSVNQQIQEVNSFKEISPEERFYQFINNRLNPFKEANFSKDHLDRADNSEYDLWKDTVMDPNMPPSLLQIYAKRPFKQDVEDLITSHIEFLRVTNDLPYDELYHKERYLVDNVIKAQQALKEKQSHLPIPFGEGRIFKIEDFATELNEHGLETQFEKDQQRLKMRDDKNSDFYVQDESKYTQMLESGKLSEKDFLRFKQIEKESRTSNFGYAFVTFSHTVSLLARQLVLQDEAKLASLLLEDFLVDNMLLQVTPKTNVDHKDLDELYKLQLQKNDAKLVDEFETLRNSKKELREFEDNIDNELPSLKKLKQFKEMTRDMFEDRKSLRGDKSMKRKAHEEETLNDKIKKAQKDNPNVDLTQLFDTDRAERARRALHKKAFASYKAFQFLKHGVEFQKKEQVKETEKEVKQSNYIDPYDFPPLQETVARFLIKDVNIRVMDGGDPITKPGRRFGYTEQEFIEAYMGKDYARAPNLDVEQNMTFGYNEALKQRFPIDKYKMVPVFEGKRKQLQDYVDWQNQKNIIAGRSEYTDFIDDIKLDEFNPQIDKEHPTEPNRTLSVDIDKRIRGYLARREAKGEVPDSFSTFDIGMISKKLRDEYFPKPKKEVEQVDAATGLPPAADAKSESKFEPFYEGEGEQDNTGEVTIDQPLKSQFKSSKKRVEEQPQGVFIKTIVEEEVVSPAPKDDNMGQVNRELLYEYKAFKERGEHLQHDFIHYIERSAKFNKQEVEKMLDEIKDDMSFEQESIIGGDFHNNHLYGINKKQKETRNIPKQSTLTDFAKESESEREEEDILSHYRQKVQEAQKLKGKKEFTEKEKVDYEQLKGLVPNLPDLETFFNATSQGSHPFEDEAYKFTEAEELKKQREQEAEDDDILYQRELQGRLYGEKLTSRQFATLYKVKNDEGNAMKFMKDKEREQFIDHRHIVKVFEEMKETHRRRQVKAGEWTEAESHVKLSKVIQKLQDESLSPEDLLKERRDFFQMYHSLQNVLHPDKLFEKEYYFDEGLGQSLKDHIDDIKTNFPDVQVQTRRDRDGFAIIKTKFQPKYKYNLDDILSYNPQQAKVTMKETLEAVYKRMYPGGQKDILSNLNKENVEELLAMMTQKNKQKFELDSDSKSKVTSLIKKRMTGIYKDNVEGFVDEFMVLTENLTFDKTKPLSTSQLLHGQIDDATKEGIYDEMYEDRQLMAQELTIQLSLKIKEHLYQKKRKQEDFVKPRRSELDIFRTQVAGQHNSIEHLEKQYKDIYGEETEKKEGFDKETFHRLKAEIKMRREAKERLLQQGIPDLKSYVTL